jgi:5'-deoxynucleotidase YfbR-like HD superfamily hydrolase
MDRVLNTTILSMKDHYRYAGMHAAHRESVAEHSFFVAIIADMVVALLKQHSPSLVVDEALVMRMALYHDIEEAYTGDIITPVKYSSDQLHEAWDTLSDTLLRTGAARDFGENSCVADRVVGVHGQYEDQKMKSIEGRIVKFADLAQSVAYLLAECRSGNTHASPVLSNVLSNMHDLFDEDSALRPHMDSITAECRGAVLQTRGTAGSPSPGAPGHDTETTGSESGAT